MKILWIVNTVMPELATLMNVNTGASGTWMIDLSKRISESENINLAIACIYGNEFKVLKGKHITYYVLPGNGKTMLFYHPNLIEYWKKVEEDFVPDLVHIHGTEYTHAISYLRNFPEKKYLLSIQGIVKKVSDNHNGGLKLSELLINRTFRENIKMSGMIEKTIVSKKNAKYEREIIQKVSFATGRTDWDKYFMHSINPDLKYYRCFYNLRDEFYSAKKWNIKDANPNKIYVSTAAQTPFKGGHIVMKAIQIVKRKHPDVKFVFLGDYCKKGQFTPKDGYSKFIGKLIRKYDLASNVEFIGRLDTNGVIKIMQESRLCIIPSAIENASATMREAMHIGTPLIASFRGGMINLVNDRESGFYYDYTEYEYLAGRINELLEDDDLVIKFSRNSISIAENMHDRIKNTNDFINMYEDILNFKQ